jgi:alcohol dehydrogenase
MKAAPALPTILQHSPIRVVFGCGAIDQLGALARDEGGRTVLLVTDPGLVAAGHAEHALHALRAAQIEPIVFDGTRENPTSDHVAAGIAALAGRRVDLIVGLGGGSALDCAKGINLQLRLGGKLSDYRGDPPADVLAKRPPLLPMICVPTTAGTGSEAQSFALISDPATRQKMACGDRRLPRAGGLRPRVALLDPDLIRTAPAAVASAAALDAVAHAVETAGSKARNDVSRETARQAWKRLSGWIREFLFDASDAEGRENMLLGAHLAGAAIEQSMLGAAHACANPLTARFGVVHGFAVGLMLPHVVRFNASNGSNPYSDLRRDAAVLATELGELLRVARAPRTLREAGVEESALPALAAEAAQQWTGTFNPRAVGAADLEDVYRAAW